MQTRRIITITLLLLSSLSFLLILLNKIEASLLSAKIILLIFVLSNLATIIEILRYGNYWQRLDSWQGYFQRLKAIVLFGLYLILFGFNGIFLGLGYFDTPSFIDTFLAISVLVFAWRSSLFSKTISDGKRALLTLLSVLLTSVFFYLTLIIYLLFWYGIASLWANFSAIAS